MARANAESLRGQKGRYNNGAYKTKEGNTWWTICAKLAINRSFLQCDYDFDWVMPEYEDGQVYDTEIGLTKIQNFAQTADDFNAEAKEIVELYNKGELR